MLHDVLDERAAQGKEPAKLLGRVDDDIDGEGPVREQALDFDAPLDRSTIRLLDDQHTDLAHSQFPGTRLDITII